MDGKERVLDGFEVFGMTRENAETMYGHLVKAVKEEITPKDQTYQEFFGLDLPEKLIQGYTAEQWQEIIDGGYLCEAKDVSTREWVPVILERMDTDDDSHPFKIKYSASSAVKDDEDHDWQEFCRPAQLKGVMRPIFVEPVDVSAMCTFFDNGYQVHEKRSRASYGTYLQGDYREATSYIEL